MWVWFEIIWQWKLINFCTHFPWLVLKSRWWDASAMHFTISCVFCGCYEFRFIKTICILPAGLGIKLVVELHRRTNISRSLSSMSSPSQGSIAFTKQLLWLKGTQCTPWIERLPKLPLLMSLKKESWWLCFLCHKTHETNLSLNESKFFYWTTPIKCIRCDLVWVQMCLNT